ncbi:hypothetical protein QTH73_01145 [Clostridium perfringens]|nr:hypothetical protein [Clostridium perfringens]
MAKKKDYDALEVEEIINLTLENKCNGVKSKLTKNKVFNYNKELVENKVRRNNGELFNEYGYHFWAGSYKGEDNYGHKKIKEKVNSNEVILAGKSFNHNINDIVELVSKYSKKPKDLTLKLCKIFEIKEKKIAMLQEQNNKLNNELIKLREKQMNFESAFATVFYNSMYTDNSMNDVMSLKKSGDKYVADEIKNMFNTDNLKLNSTIKITEEPNEFNRNEKTKLANVIDIEKEAKLKRRKEAEELFPL